MSFSQVQQEALALSERERAELAALLIDTLPPVSDGVSDEEALKRDAELESGVVQEISHQQFVEGVRRERRK